MRRDLGLLGLGVLLVGLAWQAADQARQIRALRRQLREWFYVDLGHRLGGPVPHETADDPWGWIDRALVWGAVALGAWLIGYQLTRPIWRP